jgi:hypothetical protein
LLSRQNLSIALRFNHTYYHANQMFIRRINLYLILCRMRVTIDE